MPDAVTSRQRRGNGLGGHLPHRLSEPTTHPFLLCDYIGGEAAGVGAGVFFFFQVNQEKVFFIPMFFIFR